ncbi:hypothetical protein ACFL96_05275 [Thermoproteota archaeon]
MKSDLFTLFIQTNSPGELTSFVRPIVTIFKSLKPHSKIVILLTPCQYATGNEMQIARTIKEVDQVLSPKQTLKELYSLPVIKPHHGKGAVLFLGGGPLYSQLFGLKYKLPCYAYTEHKHKPGPFYKQVFYKHSHGDLMAERVINYNPDIENILTKYHLKNHRYCLFMGGSRKQHFNAFVPRLINIVKEIKTVKPDFKALLQVSPFVSDKTLDIFQNHYDLSDFIITRGEPLDIMGVSDLMVALPGTNNAEAMYMKLPMIILIPLNRPDLIILDGVAGLIGRIPGLGTAFKRLILAIIKQKKTFHTLPNRLAQKQIVPEIAGVLSEHVVAQTIMDYYYNKEKLSEIHDNLKNLPQTHDIAKHICETILSQP